jgi:ABC-type dipeptide/oligopeptide/nickel transport system permease component
MRTSIPILISATPQIGLKEAGETPRLPSNATLKEIHITTANPSYQNLVFLGHWQGEGDISLIDERDIQGIFSYLGFGTPPYERYIRLVTNTVHLTELNYQLRQNEKIVWEAVNNTTTDPIYVDIILVLEINQE